MRRYTTCMRGERYLGNSESGEVHDLDREKLQCNIDKIISDIKEIPFSTLEEAIAGGYSYCSFCFKKVNSSLSDVSFSSAKQQGI